VRQVRFSKLTLEEHLAGVDRAEFVAGERFPLPEESRVHRLVAQNLFLAVAPLLVIEVMAPETAPTDGREKWLCYQLLDTICEVVLVGLDPREVEVRRRGWDGAWSGEVYERGEMAWLEAIGLGVSVDAVFAGVNGLTFQ
jgi:Uma2 family endonuclease